MNIKTGTKLLTGFMLGILSLCDLPHATSAEWQMPPFEFGPTSFEYNSTSAADDNGHIMVVKQQFGGDLSLYYYTNGAWTLSQTLLTPPGLAIGYSSMVAMEPSGTGLVGYHDSTSGDLSARYFNGSTWSTPTPSPLDNYPSGGGYGVLVALNGPGSGLMVWGSSSNEIKGSFLSGGTWSSPVVIDTNPFTLFAFPAIAYSTNGSAVVLSSFGQANIINYNGTSWQPKQVSVNPYNSLAGIDNSGNAILYGEDGNNIVVGFFNAVTSVLSAPQTISLGTGNSSPKIKIAPNGTAVAVWKTGALTAVFSTYNGSVWSVPQALPFEVTGSTNDYGLGMDSAGNAILGWNDSANQLLASRLPLGGTVWGPEELVAPAGTDAAKIIPGLSLNGAGFLTWLDPSTSIMFGNASLVAPTPPSDPSGFACTVKFASQSDTINEIMWTASTDPTTVVYYIRQNGVLIGTVPAAGPTSFVAHNLCKGQVYVYQITAVNATGDESPPITITL